MRILRAGAHAAVPWKNGLGVSQVLATEPAGADYDALDWQVASTAFGVDCPFSRLGGLDRQFMLLEGAGVELHCVDAAAGVDRRLRVDQAFVPQSFSGDWTTECRMLGGGVRVLNVITRRGRALAGVTVPRFDQVLMLEQAPGETLLAVVLEGLAGIAGMQPALAALDGVRLDAPEGARLELQAQSAAAVRLALVRIRPA
jgi:environmental stress-induced protein Ves